MRSPVAARELLEAVEDDELASVDVDDLMGQTDCPSGCYVEPDGVCSHGFESAAITAELI